MDPKATLEEARDRAAVGDTLNCAYALLAYAQWVSRGGFVPPDAQTLLDSIDNALDKFDNDR